jgi:hypothetical protein
MICGGTKRRETAMENHRIATSLYIRASVGSAAENEIRLPPHIALHPIDAKKAVSISRLLICQIICPLKISAPRRGRNGCRVLGNTRTWIREEVHRKIRRLKTRSFSPGEKVRMRAAFLSQPYFRVHGQGEPLPASGRWHPPACSWDQYANCPGISLLGFPAVATTFVLPITNVEQSEV